MILRINKKNLDFRKIAIGLVNNSTDYPVGSDQYWKTIRLTAICLEKDVFPQFLKEIDDQTDSHFSAESPKSC